jgi:HK97 family phage prohead protease
MGYALLWDGLSLDLGGFRERVDRAALDDTLKAVQAGQHDVLFQFNHDGQHLLGRTSSGHLRLTTDTKGLRYEARLPDTTLARDMYRLVAEGILKGASIGFSLGIDSWDRSGRTPIRTVKRMTLWEISVVARPAYFQSSAQASRASPTPTAWTAARLRAVAAKPHRPVAADALRADAQGIIRR